MVVVVLLVLFMEMEAMVELVAVLVLGQILSNVVVVELTVLVMGLAVLAYVGMVELVHLLLVEVLQTVQIEPLVALELGHWAAFQ
jgi:hypothetical protein